MLKATQAPNAAVANSGVLADFWLRIDADAMRLHVGQAARVPDSEVIAGRLSQLAGAIGLKGIVVVEQG